MKAPKDPKVAKSKDLYAEVATIVMSVAVIVMSVLVLLL